MRETWFKNVQVVKVAIRYSDVLLAKFEPW